MSTAPARTSSMSMCPSVRFFRSVAASILLGPCAPTRKLPKSPALWLSGNGLAGHEPSWPMNGRVRATSPTRCAGANVRIECCVELGGIAWYSSAS